jgi:hypothetical protein
MVAANTHVDTRLLMPDAPIARLNPKKRTIDEIAAPRESIKLTNKDLRRVFQTISITTAHMRARIRLRGKVRYERGILPISI